MEYFEPVSIWNFGKEYITTRHDIKYCFEEQLPLCVGGKKVVFQCNVDLILQSKYFLVYDATYNQHNDEFVAKIACYTEKQDLEDDLNERESLHTSIEIDVDFMRHAQIFMGSHYIDIFSMENLV
jgi:hypothetical protein